VQSNFSGSSLPFKLKPGVSLSSQKTINRQHDRLCFFVKFVVEYFIATKLVINFIEGRMVAHNPDSQHILSSSKDPTSRNRHVSSSIGCRKALIIIAFLAAIIVILLRPPPNVTSDDSSHIDDQNNRPVTGKKNRIRLIAILGERNSGTRWTFE
jgi:hypothetical protein